MNGEDRDPLPCWNDSKVRKSQRFSPIARQVRFRNVTLSFHIVDDQSVGIGEETVNLIRIFKKWLESELAIFMDSLPKLVRCVVWEENPQASNASGTFGGALPLLPFPYHISTNTNCLHQEELRLEKARDFQLRLLWVLLHELAHFITPSDKGADQIALGVLREMLKKPARSGQDSRSKA